MVNLVHVTANLYHICLRSHVTKCLWKKLSFVTIDKLYLKRRNLQIVHEIFAWNNISLLWHCATLLTFNQTFRNRTVLRLSNKCKAIPTQVAQNVFPTLTNSKNAHLTKGPFANSGSTAAAQKIPNSTKFLYLTISKA